MHVQVRAYWVYEHLLITFGGAHLLAMFSGLATAQEPGQQRPPSPLRVEPFLVLYTSQ